MDQRVHVGLEGPDQERRDPGEDDDSVRVDEPVAEVDELAGEVAVAGEDRAQPREALVGGICREDQNRERQALDEVVDERARRPRREGRAGDLRDDRDRVARQGVHVDGQVRDADEQRDRHSAHDQQGLRRVPALRRLERTDAVRDRLDAGQRRGAGREGPEDHQDSDAAGGADGDRIRDVCLWTSARGALRDPGRDHHVHHDDEGVSRESERDPRLANPSQVHDRQQQDQEQRQADLVGRERWGSGRDRKHAGRHRDRDREHVVDEQRRRRNQAGQRAEVLLGDDVRAAAGLVGLDGLGVREDDDPEHDRDRNRDGWTRCAELSETPTSTTRAASVA